MKYFAGFLIGMVVTLFITAANANYYRDDTKDIVAALDRMTTAISKCK
jgi:hypothetical protein